MAILQVNPKGYQIQRVYGMRLFGAFGSTFVQPQNVGREVFRLMIWKSYFSIAFLELAIESLGKEIGCCSDEIAVYCEVLDVVSNEDDDQFLSHSFQSLV